MPPFNPDNDSDVLTLVTRVFQSLKKASSVEEVRDILNTETVLAQAREKAMKDPQWTQRISKAEIEELRKRKLLNARNEISTEALQAELTPLEKLLLAMVWKRKGFKKFKYVVEGILDGKPDAWGEHQLHEFGRFLLNPDDELLIHRHVIVAMDVIEFIHSPDDVNIRADLGLYGARSSIYTQAVQQDDIARYKRWQQNEWPRYLMQTDGFREAVEEVLLYLGKVIAIDWNGRIYAGLPPDFI